MNEYRIKHDHGGMDRQKEGISSIAKLDSNLVFRELNLKKDNYFLDIGCGAGDYSFYASKLLKNSGFVYALERWKELTKKINNKIEAQNIKNMKAIYADITKNIPLNDNCIDICFMALVLHGFDLENHEKDLFSEIYRILKSNGTLAVIEMKKETNSETHPEKIRLSPIETEKLVAKYDFVQTGYTDLKDFYMVQFSVRK